MQQQVPETVYMTVLGTAVSWGVAVDVFGIDIGSCHDQRLNYTQIATDTGNM